DGRFPGRVAEHLLKVGPALEAGALGDPTDTDRRGRENVLGPLETNAAQVAFERHPLLASQEPREVARTEARYLGNLGQGQVLPQVVAHERERALDAAVLASAGRALNRALEVRYDRAIRRHQLGDTGSAAFGDRRTELVEGLLIELARNQPWLRQTSQT